MATFTKKILNKKLCKNSIKPFCERLFERFSTQTNNVTSHIENE